MTFQPNELQTSFYAQTAYGLLKARSTPNNNIFFRHINTAHDYSTQLLNELGTTDVAIGDVTAEIMITTLGKIPNEMYYLEDTTPNGKATAYGTEIHTISNNTTLTLVDIAKSDGYTGRSTLLLILLLVLLIILMLCCITACIIARSKRKYTFFTKSDIECSPECSGINQPLLSLDKISDTTTKTSSGSTRN